MKVYERQSNLAKKLYEQQTALAEQNKQKNLSELQAQLREQRMNMQSSRSDLGEHAWSARRGIEQQANARGVGSSGLKNLALVQNQMATGGAYGQLESQNQEVQRAAMDTRRDIYQGADNTRIGQDLAYQQSMLQAEQQRMAEEEKKSAFLMQLYEAALGGASQQDIASLARLSGYDINSLTEEQRSTLTGAAYDPTEGAEVTRNISGWGKMMSTIGEGLTDTLRLITGDENVNKVGSIFAGGNSISYNIGSQRIEATSREEAEKKITQLYANKPYISNGSIAVRVDPISGRVTFVNKNSNEEFSTYEKAAQSLTTTK